LDPVLEQKSFVYQGKSMTNPIEILLVEDHQVVRHGLRLLIESQPNMRVVGEASSGEEAIDLLKTITPNLVVFDVSLPGMSGIELARQLQKDEDSGKEPLLLDIRPITIETRKARGMVKLQLRS
jgi:CheY-like chemotaxis protein